MSEIKEFVCIRCPLGCNVKAEVSEGEIVSITGNTCPRGAEYVTAELTAPMRTVTSIVTVDGGVRPVVSVKTASDIPKGEIMNCVKAIKESKVTAPITIGQVIVADVCGTGVDVIATDNCDAVQGG